MQKAPAKRVAVAAASQSVRSEAPDDNAGPTETRARPATASSGLEECLDLTADEFCRAESGSHVIRTLLDHSAHDASRCVLFGVKDAEAFIRDVCGFVLDAVCAHRARFAITTEPLLTLLSGEAFYRGPVPRQPQYRGFFDTLRRSPPAEILLLPMYRQDRIAALLYADSGTEARIAGETESFLRAARKFTLSLDLIDLKQRIRST